MSPAAWALVVAIRGYKLLVSPFLPPSCRFEPTCSRYAEQTVRRFGAVRGTRLAIGRVARCRPGVPGGDDPPPLE